jgi:hypothetical protein
VSTTPPENPLSVKIQQPRNGTLPLAEDTFFLTNATITRRRASYSGVIILICPLLFLHSVQIQRPFLLSINWNTVPELRKLPFNTSEKAFHKPLTDIESIDHLIGIRLDANGIESEVDSIPIITADESGKVEGIKGLENLEDPDIFTQFVPTPFAFRDFVTEHFDRAYSPLFATRSSPSIQD